MKIFDLDKLIDSLTGYLETKVELIIHDAKEELSGLIAKFLVFAMLTLFGLLAILFLSIASAVAINLYIDSSFLGFVIVGGIYLGLAGLIYGKREDLLEKVKDQATKAEKEEN
ncbi:phage holin family protein [Roseivirga misakiensis]|uniref:Phage holin family protein n=1 Tax=Roseivirga misakiensis TaxID=1563681 RepID=A0A1E5T3K4_9BACT|nr:phage holin family protein [Roseivirga misakiensis]OEK05921.1 hypothetical protein BFP71_07355 [Roseivirga misakiensis]